MKKVFIISGGAAYVALFARMGYERTANEQEADLFVFTGGEDVSPNLYGHEKHNTTWSNPDRDRYEKALFNIAIARGVPMVGICRGAQFLNVMSGGTMYQNVTTHGNDHAIIDVRTEEHINMVSSTHHQMMRPCPEGVLVAVAPHHHMRVFWCTDEKRFKFEDTVDGIEVVYYPTTQCLCFQPHPEFGGNEYEGMYAYFNGLVQEFL